MGHLYVLFFWVHDNGIPSMSLVDFISFLLLWSVFFEEGLFIPIYLHPKKKKNQVRGENVFSSYFSKPEYEEQAF